MTALARCHFRFDCASPLVSSDRPTSSFSSRVELVRFAITMLLDRWGRLRPPPFSPPARRGEADADESEGGGFGDRRRIEKVIQSDEAIS